MYHVHHQHAGARFIAPFVSSAVMFGIIAIAIIGRDESRLYENHRAN
jgi:hypothetical protein